MNEWLSRSTIITPTFLTRGVDGQRFFEGVASVYYNPADPGTEYVTERAADGTPLEVERIMPGAFDRALKERMDVVMVYDHDPRAVLARSSSGTLELWSDNVGLNYRAPYDETDPDHQRAYSNLLRKDLPGSSFKFWPRAGGVKVERARGAGPRVVWMQDVYLYDVGPVVNPAYRSASAKARSIGEETEREQRTREYLERIQKPTTT